MSTTRIRLRTAAPCSVTGYPPSCTTRIPIRRFPGVCPSRSPSYSTKYPHCITNIVNSITTTATPSNSSFHDPIPDQAKTSARNRPSCAAVRRAKSKRSAAKRDPRSASS
jgi:hypothetical protein